MSVFETLAKSGFVDKVSLQECCLVVVPSPRVRASEFVMSLLNSGIYVRVMGHGSGRVIDATGSRYLVHGMLILAAGEKEVRKIAKYAKLFGITTVRAASRRKMNSGA